MKICRMRALSIFTIVLFTSPMFAGELSANDKTENISAKNDTAIPAFTGISQNLSIYGMVKVDFIYDFDEPSGDRINYNTISADDTKAQGQSRIHARESRIGAKYLKDINGNDFTAFIEGDFYGGGTNSPSGSEKISNGVNFRLRHAYFAYGDWLVGQTWSNYVDVKSFPETLDFSNETGQAFVRQGQIRYQHKVDKFTFSYSLENPETDVYILEDMFSEGTDFQTIDPIADFTAKVKFQPSWGHLSLQLVARKQKVHIHSDSVSDTGYGVGTSGRINVTAKDTVKFHYSQGKGIGRYIQEVAGSSGLVFPSTSATEDDLATLTLLTAEGGYIGYQHRINKSLRVNANAGFIDIDYSSMNNLALLFARTQSLLSVHSNIIWTVLPNLDIGVEYSTVKLKTVAGDKGSIKRIQLATTFRF